MTRACSDRCKPTGGTPARAGHWAAWGLACVVALAGAWPAAATPSGEPLTWLLLGIPPNSIIVDGQPGDGQYDLILKMVTASMPGREHKVLYANIKRVTTLLAQGYPACFVSSSVSDERREIAHLSINGVAPPIRLLTRRQTVPRLPLNRHREVLVEQLFERQDLSGALEQGRPYSPHIDAALARTTAPALQRSRTQSIQMLRSGHVDYTIGFDAQLQYELSSGEHLPGDAQLVSLPIAGESVRYTAFACPRTPWGRQTIDEIDVALQRLAGSPDYVAALLKWLGPQEKERMLPVIRDFMRLRAASRNFETAPASHANPR